MWTTTFNMKEAGLADSSFGQQYQYTFPFGSSEQRNVPVEKLTIFLY